LVGLAALWRLGRDEAKSLPTAAVAASRPTPAAPATPKGDEPNLNALGRARPAGAAEGRRADAQRARRRRLDPSAGGAGAAHAGARQPPVRRRSLGRSPGGVAPRPLPAPARRRGPRTR